MEKLVRVMLWWNEAKQVLHNQKGQGMVEYGLILALVAVMSIAAFTAMNGGLGATLTKVTTQLNK